MPGITPEIFRRALPVDYRELKRAGERIAAELSAASSCRVTSPAGTDLDLSLKGRIAICDDGNLQAKQPGEPPRRRSLHRPHRDNR